MPGMFAQDMITDIPPVGASTEEHTEHPTQKPLALLRLYIEASTKPGDTVLDPFCVDSTALVAAEGLGRAWIGIDVSSVDVRLTHEWLCDELRLVELNVVNMIGCRHGYANGKAENART